MNLLDEAINRVRRKLRREPPYIHRSSQWLDSVRLRSSSLGNQHAPLTLCMAFLAFSRDIRMFVQCDKLLCEFDLNSHAGICPYPLFNLNDISDISAPHELRSLLHIPPGALACKLPELCGLLRKIQIHKLLGRNTSGKLAFVRFITDHRLATLDTSYIQAEIIGPIEAHFEPFRTVELEDYDNMVMRLVSKTREQLNRQIRRLGNDHQRTKDVQACLAELNEIFPSIDSIRHRIRELISGDPRQSVGYHSLCLDYADDVVQVLFEEDPSLLSRLSGPCHYVTGVGIEARYVPREFGFLQLGDRYGDCTASSRRKQLDKHVVNIHETVYSWMLDPYYRVLEVLCDGEGVLKAHLLPLVIGGQNVLAVDAIEVVPEIRGPSSDRPGLRMYSERLLRQRCEIISCLEQTVRRIADQMGIVTIIVDAFSNAAWIREWVETLSFAAYHVSDVVKPFGSAYLEKLWEQWMGTPGTGLFRMEIQALNLGLIDHGLREGYKTAGVLRGALDGLRLPLRGP